MAQFQSYLAKLLCHSLLSVTPKWAFPLEDDHFVYILSGSPWFFQRDKQMPWMISWSRNRCSNVMFIFPEVVFIFPEVVHFPWGGLYYLRSGFGPSFDVAKLCGSWRCWAPWWNFLSMCAIWIRHHFAPLEQWAIFPGYLLDCTAQLHRDIKIIKCIVRIPINQPGSMI